MINTIMTRVSARMTGETYDNTVMTELAQTILDRLCLRLGVTEATFPTLFQSIAVDATVKAWRRRYFEGLSSEGTVNLTSSFVSDILHEYDAEINDWLASSDASEALSANRKGVHWV